MGYIRKAKLMFPWANGRTSHPKLVTYKPGTIVNGWRILERAPSLGHDHGNARWKCEHLCNPNALDILDGICKAGAVRILDGIYLRSKPPKFCDACRPKGSRAGPSCGRVR